MDNRIFKAYVKELMTEDDGGGGGFDFGGFGGYGGGMGMYGVGTNQGLYNIFVRPFVEVIQTASGVTKEIMRSATTLFSVALETIITTFVPIVSDTYEEIFAAERKDIEEIREKYKDIYSANTAMFYHSDMNVLAFAMDPTQFFTARFFAKSPKAASKALELISGDNSVVTKWIQKIKDIYNFGDEDFDKKYRRKSEAKTGRVLVEEDQKADVLVQMFNDKNVRAAIENSQYIRGMRADAENTIKRFCASVKQAADDVNKVHDFNSLYAYIKNTKSQKAVKALDDIKRGVTKEQQLASIVPQFTAQAKKAIKGVYGSGIAKQIEAAKASGMSDSSNIITMLKSAQGIIEKLK